MNIYVHEICNRMYAVHAVRFDPRHLDLGVDGFIGQAGGRGSDVQTIIQGSPGQALMGITHDQTS